MSTRTYGHLHEDDRAWFVADSTRLRRRTGAIPACPTGERSTAGMGSRMTGADGDHLPMPARRDPWFAMADFLAKEAETLKTDPGFAAEVNTAAHRLAIPLPAAVVSDRTCSAVARRCSDLVASGELRQAAALLAGHRLAIERWFRLHGARWRTDRASDRRR